jgi:hypothetical protein
VELTRRQVLSAILASGALAACSGQTTSSSVTAATTAAGAPPSSAPAAATTSATASASATAQPTTVATPLPSARAWVARRGEVQPSIKARATALVEAVGTWTDGGGDLASARARATAAGFAPGLADLLAALLGPEPAAVVRVRDAQYGGILTSSASVLVVVDQWRATAAGQVSAGGRTVDVRLVAASPTWRVVDALPAKPGAASMQITRAAKAVLADSRLHLPYSARSDVTAGLIHDSVLVMLTALAREHVVDVSVLRSGHPLHVFGTSRTSDHTRGQAVDVWALDGQPLVVPDNHALATRGMAFAVAHGAYNVGGPVQLSGRQYFSDRTHQDHIHLGFNH